MPGVAVDFGKSSQRFLRRLTVTELETLLVQEPFSAGSMGPKVRAAYRFVRGSAGTLVVPGDAMQLSFRA